MSQVATAPRSVGASQQSGLGSAHALLWLGFGMLLATVLIGLEWDRAWHATHAFENFYSPPHLFIYGMSALTVALVAYLTFDARVRKWFGPAIRLPVLPFAVPGALLVLGGALAVLALAGVLDDIWHTSFGLDETGWSTPHAMLGWAWLATVLGFVACRLALRPYRPLSWPAVVVLMYCVLGFSLTPFLGPLHSNKTPETVLAVSRIPVLQAQAPPQHTFRIYEHWNLNQTNPILIPLGALWFGMALALLRALDRRARLWLSVVLVFSVLQLLSEHNTARALEAFEPGLASHPENWLPLPVLPAALVFALLSASGLRDHWAWLGAGLMFGLLVWLTWDRTLGSLALAVLAAPLALLGAALAARVYRVLEQPSAGDVVRLLVMLPIGVPLLTGIFDLLLRHVTP